MTSFTLPGRVALAALVVFVAGAGDVVRSDPGESKFHEAYYLENAEGDWSGAAKLYEQVAGDRKASMTLRAEAAARLAACREEVACRDFARLMPPDALAYVELNHPGRQIEKLLDQLGLLADVNQVFEAGQRRVAVSPTLLREGLGLGGVAVAITGFDPQAQQPSGVVVLHPGDLGVIRGLLETGLPAGANVVEPVGGYATFDVEGEALVTLTSRLVIASTDRAEIEGVVKRLAGKNIESLADNPAMMDMIKGRGDALLTFFVNAKPLIPMIKGIVAAEGGEQELAMAQALLDLDSLNSISGHFGVSDDGLSLDIALRLDEGHRNLVYNLLRTPALNPETLACVPAGAAVVVLGALNRADSSYDASSADDEGHPVVTALDIGREFFANITGLALFVLSPEDGRSEGASPVPDIGLVLTVNDPSQSEALWLQTLGVASLAAGGGGVEGSPVEIEGVSTRRFQLPVGITIHFAVMGNDVLIASSESAVARSIAAKRGGKSMAKDEAFAASLKRLSPDATKAVLVHAGRSAAVAKRFMPPGEAAQIAPIIAVLSGTVVSMVTEHSDNELRFTAVVSGVPDVGDLVAYAITQEALQQEKQGELRRAMRSEDWETANAVLETQLRENPGDLDALRKKFNVVAIGQKDRKAAIACGEDFLEAAHDSATALNNFAWALLTDDDYGGEYDKLALKISARSNGLTEHGNWMFVDTLALAMFRTGDVGEAVELEKKAIELCGTCGGLGELKNVLAGFEAGTRDAGTGG